MNDERKPLAPDRPGWYLLGDGEVITIGGCTSNGCWISVDRGYGEYNCWNPDGSMGGDTRPDDIISRVPDDAAWCLAQARLLCPSGYAVVSIPDDLRAPAAMLEGDIKLYDASTDRPYADMGGNDLWMNLSDFPKERWVLAEFLVKSANLVRAVIASTAEGK